jgi:NAD(P)H-nitrite reductase large subunit
MGKFHTSYKVCKCKDVTLGEIIHSIEKANAKTIEDIGDITDAGTACGCCRSYEDDYGTPKMELYLDKILKKIKT